MQQNSLFMGCNYLNRDITTDTRTSYRLCPVQDLDSVLTNRYGLNVEVDDTFSLLYGDLYLRQLKETLKHTMLVHESVFESQIHELHRLYRRQKELMMEMEETRKHEALYLNSSFSSPTTHWMSSNVSMNLPYGDNIPNQAEAVDNVKKSEKMVLDLELPVFECHDGEEERCFMNSDQVHERANKLQLDLNEPAKIDEHYQFMSPVSSNDTREESNKKDEGEESVKGSCWMNEAQGCGIDLNMYPLSEEEVNIVKKLGTEKPQECLSEQSRVVVQALPCLNSSLLLNKPHKSYKARKKVELGPMNKASKGSDLDLHSSAQATADSQTDHTSCSVRNHTSLGRRRGGDKVVAKKRRKKSRRVCLVTEGKYQEISAAEAMVDMSRKSDHETCDFITSLSRNLLLLAEVSSLVIVDSSEAKTLQLTQINLKNHRLNTADNKTAVSSIVLRKERRSDVKRKCKDDQHTNSECEANKDLQVMEKVVGVTKNKSRSCPLKQIESFTSLVDWGAVSKRRRGTRTPAADVQHMIIKQ